MPRRTNRVVTRAPAGAVLSVVHDDVAYRVAVKRVGSARRFTLRVKAATLEAVLTMPARASLRTALNFAERHADWIGARLRAMPGPIEIRDGLLLPVRGVDHRIVQRAGAPGRTRAEATLHPAVPGREPEIRVTGEAASVGRLVEGLLRREALRDLRAAAQRHAAAIGRDFARITVRDTRSRWGSCSARGALNFSWRLIMAPPFVLDYLAAHEVAHLRHLNHSASFWAVTEQLAPRIAEAEAWLKHKGQHLHRYAMR